MQKVHCVKITTNSVVLDNKRLQTSFSGQKMLKEIYQQYIGNYPRFHKMDILCQLGFISSELLLDTEGEDRFIECMDRAIIIYGRNASVVADRNYQQTISDLNAFYPSPSFFVYTLPNIVAGEIALRNHVHGETAYIAVENKDQMVEHIECFIETAHHINSILCGWVDATSINEFEVEMWIIK